MAEARRVRQEKETLVSQAKVVYDRLISLATTKFTRDNPMTWERVAGEIPGVRDEKYHPMHGNILAGILTHWNIGGGHDEHTNGWKPFCPPGIYLPAALTPTKFHQIAAMDSENIRHFITSGESHLAKAA